MDEDFLLETETARNLFHNYAENLPILDYHCHISPQEIAQDRRFDNIAQLWLGEDHYKWRAMRANGIEEKYITGDAPDREKFQKWAETLEKAIGNPIYHWSHLELQRYFDYHGILNGETAENVWTLCNEKLRREDMSARNLIRKSGVSLICTTDDPTDSLKWHDDVAADDSFKVRLLPTWRPDRAMNLEKADYPEYVQMLSKVSGVGIRTFADLERALKVRMEYFAERGCVAADHSLEYVMYAPASPEAIEEIFAKRLKGETISRQEELEFKTAFMQAEGRFCHSFEWVMQLHFGVKRDNNLKIFKALGADAGADCIGNYVPSSEIADFLNSLAERDQLPKTILYNLNPADNAAVGTVIGCFQGPETAGKIQQGAAWWFCDSRQGMTDQMISLANQGLLGNFIGMLTDSRSFLSYPRHEYFRRILCNLIGGWVENGEYPNDEKALKELICGICCDNALRYFGFGL